MKYDAQLTQLKNLLPTAANILIALPAGSNIDKLAAGLALLLSLSQQGKKITIVGVDIVRVGQAHLFGIDQIKNTLPSNGGGNFILSLEGVVNPNQLDNPIPALENLDWYPEGNNLNLVFHVKPGQTFQPAKITSSVQSGNFGMVFTIGAASLDSLGNIYGQNPRGFNDVHLVNIDVDPANTNFGQTNVVDTNAATVSEVVQSVLTDLGLPLDADIASNILAGIFEATANLTNPKVNADTFMAVANCLRVGGKRPNAPVQGFDLSMLMPQESKKDMADARQADSVSTAEFIVPPVAQSEQNIPSPEERPSGERVTGESEIEPDWLTPKVYKGSSVG